MCTVQPAQSGPSLRLSDDSLSRRYSRMCPAAMARRESLWLIPYTKALSHPHSNLSRSALSHWAKGRCCICRPLFTHHSCSSGQPLNVILTSSNHRQSSPPPWLPFRHVPVVRRRYRQRASAPHAEPPVVCQDWSRESTTSPPFDILPPGRLRLDLHLHLSDHTVTSQHAQVPS
ncbi:hypothetical protein BS50DRAFT_17691 [Corynespora cassiicola Philippines]|uniref:Uncharacterized protein n=1 Tax=Corynespora cassiicola Philippines TaxID=1448308 RepID=A0A2T2PA05_CORCC|nr:hypothetical protein BS50DRAFT_17691 [Corynespora cassiicola Philippines]